MAGTRQPGGQREVIITTASIVLSNQDIGKIIGNRGAVGGITITLPAPNVENMGGTITVLSQANQTLLVNCVTADTLVITNDLNADSVQLATAALMIGGGFDFVSDGVGWQVLPRVFAGQTITTAT